MQAVAAEVIVEIIIENGGFLPVSLREMVQLEHHVRSKSFIVFVCRKQLASDFMLNALQEAKKNGEIIAFSCS